MPRGLSLTKEDLQKRLDVWWECGRSLQKAAQRLGGISCNCVNDSVNRAQAMGLKPKTKPPVSERQATIAEIPLDQKIIARIRKSAASAEDIAKELKVAQKKVRAEIKALHARGFNIHEIAGRFTIREVLQPAADLGPAAPYVSRKDNTFVFGAIADTHYGSKYERDDVVQELFAVFADSKVDRVYHAGNWIEGEARFNRHELLRHGMDEQCRYLAERWPQKPGLVTYAIAGDDHEGWYAQREGVDIGRYAQNAFHDAGRSDWKNLGYMEANVPLVNRNTGARARMSVIHPGGGSSYAISYSVQKYIESLEGGEKPDVALFGHYHKAFYASIRNVHCVQVPSTQDQSLFMRKLKSASIVGGLIITLRQDPDSGAIVSCAPEFIIYFNRQWHEERNNRRWSLSGPTNTPLRTTHPR